ncbi:MAG: hypothetical protein N3A66_08200, partial [Planctomycetota bacterium]|nr:hypothetical protein [Planctomycetota bacterium]
MKTAPALGIFMASAAILLNGCGGTKSAESAEGKKSLLARVTAPVADAAKSVADVVSKPFTDKKPDDKEKINDAAPSGDNERRKADLAARTCSDNYETLRPGTRRRDAWAEPKEEYRSRDLETAAPTKTPPRLPEATASAEAPRRSGAGDADAMGALLTGRMIGQLERKRLKVCLL